MDVQGLLRETVDNVVGMQWAGVDGLVVEFYRGGTGWSGRIVFFLSCIVYY